MLNIERNKMINSEQVFEEVMMVETTPMEIAGVNFTLRSLTKEMKAEVAEMADFESAVTFLTSNGLVFEGVRANQHDSYTPEKFLEFWSYPQFDEELQDLVAEEICKLSGIETPQEEASLEDLEQELSEIDLAADTEAELESIEVH